MKGIKAALCSIVGAAVIGISVCTANNSKIDFNANPILEIGYKPIDSDGNPIGYNRIDSDGNLISGAGYRIR